MVLLYWDNSSGVVSECDLRYIADCHYAALASLGLDAMGHPLVPGSEKPPLYTPDTMSVTFFTRPGSKPDIQYMLPHLCQSVGGCQRMFTERTLMVDDLGSKPPSESIRRLRKSELITRVLYPDFTPAVVHRTVAKVFGEVAGKQVPDASIIKRWLLRDGARYLFLTLLALENCHTDFYVHFDSDLLHRNQVPGTNWVEIGRQMLLQHAGVLAVLPPTKDAMPLVSEGVQAGIAGGYIARWQGVTGARLVDQMSTRCFVLHKPRWMASRGVSQPPFSSPTVEAFFGSWKSSEELHFEMAMSVANDRQQHIMQVGRLTRKRENVDESNLQNDAWVVSALAARACVTCGFVRFTFPMTQSTQLI